MPQEATAKSIFNTVEDTKKVIIIIFSITGQIAQKMNIQAQTMNQTIQTTQTNKKTQTKNFPHTFKKEDTFEIVKSTTPIIISSENNASNNELTRENLIIDEGQPNNK